MAPWGPTASLNGAQEDSGMALARIHRSSSWISKSTSNDPTIVLPGETQTSQRHFPLTWEKVTAWHDRWNLLTEQQRQSILANVQPGSVSAYAQTIQDLLSAGVESSRITRIVDSMEPFMNVVSSVGKPASSAVDTVYPGTSAIFGAITWAFRASRSFVDCQRQLVEFLEDRVVKNLLIVHQARQIFASDPNVNAVIADILWDVVKMGITAAEIFKDPRKRAKFATLVKTSLGWSSELEDLNKISQKFDTHLERFDRALNLAHAVKTTVQLPREEREREQRYRDVKDAQDAASNRHLLLKWIADTTKKLECEHRHEELQTTDNNAGKWLFSNSVFRAWKSDGKPGSLWVSGKMGCGKSVVASNVTQQVLNDIQEGASMAMASVYCSSGIDMTYIAVLGTILHQLYGYLPPDQNIERVVQAWMRDQMFSTTIEQAIFDLIPRFTRTFIIVDGLDEFHRTNPASFDALCKFLSSLNPKATTALSPLRLLVFSRPDYSSITKAMTSSSRLEIHAVTNADDISSFVDTKLIDLDVDDVSRPIIRQHLIDRADGSFIWVSHVISRIKKARTPKKMIEGIKKMPKELMDVYAEILQRIIGQVETDDETDDEADEDGLPYNGTIDALIWVTRSPRPLTRSELQEALSVRPGIKAIDNHTRIRANILDQLCEQSEGLLEFSNNQYQLAHDSVRQFLEDPPTKGRYDVEEYRRWNEMAEARLAKACLTYLGLDVFIDGPTQSYTQLSQLREKYPLLGYAANHWGHHLRKANDGSRGVDDGLESLVRTFFASTSSRDLSMQIIRVDNHPFFKPQSYPFPYKDSVSLHHIAWFGLQHLLQNGDFGQLQDIFHKRDSYKLLPLDYAIAGNQMSIFDWMLDHFDVDSSHEDPVPGSPFESVCSILFLAASKNWSGSVKILLALGFDKNMRDAEENSPLHAASLAGALEAIHVLLEAGADLDLQNERKETPLMAAALFQEKAACRILLDQNADANISRFDGATVLHCMAEYDSDLVEILLQKGATFKEMNGNKTPLHAAASNGQLESIRMLGEHLQNKGGSILQDELARKNEAGNTPLAVATPKASRILIDEFGDDPLQKLHNGGTLLHRAAAFGDPDLISFLVGKGVDPNEADDDLLTPLHLASDKGHISSVKRLLELHPTLDCLKQDQLGRVALHFAASCGSLEMVQLLSGTGANTPDANGNLPLHCAIASGELMCVETLLHQTTNLTTDHLKKALRLAVEQEFCEIVSYLLDYRADKNWRLVNGATTLHIAAETGNEDMVRLLVSRGCELTCQDELGTTPFMHAITHGHVNAARIILGERYEMLEIRDNEGETCAHRAAWSGSLEMWDFVRSLNPEGCASITHIGQNPVFYAALCGSASMVDRLIADGLVPDAQDNSGWTPLMDAATLGYIGVVNRLLSIVDSNHLHQFDSTGRSPLHWACIHGFLNVAKVLLDAGFDNRPDHLGLAPTDYATNHPDFLLAMKMKIGNAGDKEGSFKPTDQRRELCDFIKHAALEFSEGPELQTPNFQQRLQLTRGLAFALIKIGRSEDAAYILSQFATSPTFTITCSICEERFRGRYMACEQCYETELCYACHEHYSEAEKHPVWRRTIEFREFEASLIAAALEPMRHVDALWLSQFLHSDDNFAWLVNTRLQRYTAAFESETLQGGKINRGNFPGWKLFGLLKKILQLTTRANHGEDHEPQTPEALTKQLRDFPFQKVARDLTVFSCHGHRYFKVVTVDELDEEEKAHFNSDGLLKPSFFANLSRKYTLSDEELGQLLATSNIRDHSPPADVACGKIAEERPDEQLTDPDYFDIYKEMAEVERLRSLLDEVDNPYLRAEDRYAWLDQDADVELMQESSWRLAKAFLVAFNSEKSIALWCEEKGVPLVVKTTNENGIMSEGDGM